MNKEDLKSAYLEVRNELETKTSNDALKCLIEEIERLNNIINLIKNNIDITIQIIKEQPIGNDEWILERLNGIKNIC